MACNDVQIWKLAANSGTSSWGQPTNRREEEEGGRGSPACEFGRGQTIPRHNKWHATQHYKGHWTLKLNVWSLHW